MTKLPSQGIVEFSIPSEAEIVVSWSGTEPLLSIICNTYNHENYISDAIKGFLLQRTSFPFEILIHDDASTDKTAKIVAEFAMKYPKLIKPILQQQNLLQIGFDPIWIQLNRAKGKYVALCEGDDFWINPFKLQGQVNSIEMNDSCVMSVCNYIRVSEAQHVYVNNTENSPGVLLSKQLANWQYFHTSTLVIVKEIFVDCYREYILNNTVATDTTLRFAVMEKGNVAYWPNIGSAYRQTPTGMWSGLDNSKRIDWHIAIHKDLSKRLRRENRYIQHEYLSNIYMKIATDQPIFLKAKLLFIGSLYWFRAGLVRIRRYLIHGSKGRGE